MLKFASEMRVLGNFHSKPSVDQLQTAVSDSERKSGFSFPILSVCVLHIKKQKTIDDVLLGE